MTGTLTERRSKSPPQRLWKALNQIKQQKSRRKIQKSVSFSHQLQVVPTALCLSEADEDTLWWTEDELEVMAITAKANGELNDFRKGLMKAQFQIQDVLKEQDRLRWSGQLGSDWKPIARVSRKGSLDASRQARRNGIEHENFMLQDCGKPENQSSPKCGNGCAYYVRLLRSRWLKVQPVLE
ncbi:MAG: hypothetical protein SGBAC_004887 [Bacillariaceae sp.]